MSANVGTGRSQPKYPKGCGVDKAVDYSSHGFLERQKVEGSLSGRYEGSKCRSEMISAFSARERDMRMNVIWERNKSSFDFILILWPNVFHFKYFYNQLYLNIA